MDDLTDDGVWSRGFGTAERAELMTGTFDFQV